MTNLLFQILFVLYMAIVAVLLINMLIAMMGNTYTKIAETKNEWQRQWARIVLVVERGVAPHDRLKKFNDYSQTMADGRAALILRLNQTVCYQTFAIKTDHKTILSSFSGRREDGDEGHPRDEACSREDVKKASTRARRSPATNGSRSTARSRNESEGKAVCKCISFEIVQ